MVEGIRKPVVSASTVFSCPTCSANLSIDYWSWKINAFRVGFICGAIILYFILSKFETPLLPLLLVAALYVVSGWVLLQRIRGVVLMKNQPALGDKNAQA